MPPGEESTRTQESGEREGHPKHRRAGIAGVFLEKCPFILAAYEKHQEDFKRLPIPGHSQD